MIREIKEETNLDIYNIKFLLMQEIIAPKDFFKKAHFVSMNYACRAKNTDVRLNNEAQSYKWVAAESALKLRLNKPTKGTLPSLVNNCFFGSIAKSSLAFGLPSLALNEFFTGCPPRKGHPPPRLTIVVKVF